MCIQSLCLTLGHEKSAPSISLLASPLDSSAARSLALPLAKRALSIWLAAADATDIADHHHSSKAGNTGKVGKAGKQDVSWQSNV